MPNKSVSEILKSLSVKTFSSILQMLLRKIDLSSEKIGRWRKKWTVVSMSLPQQQTEFTRSRKFCLNLWSRRWLKPNPSLAISFIPVGLWQLKVLLRVGCMNCKMFFLKRSKLLELLILLSTLLHSVTVDGKNEFLKKRMSDIELRDFVDIIWCSICCPSGGAFIKQILGELIFSYLKEIAKLLNHQRCYKDSKPNSW